MRGVWTWVFEAFHNTKFVSPQKVVPGIHWQPPAVFGRCKLSTCHVLRGPIVQGSQKLG